MTSVLKAGAVVFRGFRTLVNAGRVAQHCAPMGTVGCPRAPSLSPGLSDCFLSVSGLLGSGFGGSTTSVSCDVERRARLLTCVCVLPVDLTSFVTHFEWDMAKYPAKQPLVSVVDTLAKVREGPSLGEYLNLRDRVGGTPGPGEEERNVPGMACWVPSPAASCQP